MRGLPPFFPFSRELAALAGDDRPAIMPMTLPTPHRQISQVSMWERKAVMSHVPPAYAMPRFTGSEPQKRRKLDIFHLDFWPDSNTNKGGEGFEVPRPFAMSVVVVRAKKGIFSYPSFRPVGVGEKFRLTERRKRIVCSIPGLVNDQHNRGASARRSNYSEKS